MHLDDHVLGLLDAEKPYIEIIDGRGREKVSPDWPHARAQIVLGGIFENYAERCGGETGSELRFVSVDASGDAVTLLPDVSYYSAEQIETMTNAEDRYPRRPPYAAIEVRSSDDRSGERERKIEIYLEHGSRIVLDVDPRRETLTAIDASSRRTYSKEEVFEHEALPGLRIELSPLFARINRKR